MVVPAHLGFAHPNLLWIVGAGILAFAAGLGVNLYRSNSDSSPPDPAASDEEAK